MVYRGHGGDVPLSGPSLPLNGLSRLLKPREDIIFPIQEIRGVSSAYCDPVSGPEVLPGRSEGRDDEIVRAGLDADREVWIVGADLVGYAVQGEGQPAIELVDARELPADDLPGDYARGAGRPAAVEEIGGGIPEEGAVVKPPHEGEGEDDGVAAQILMERRVEEDAVALDVRWKERELGAGLLGKEPPRLGAVPRRVGPLERSHVETRDTARCAQDQGEGEAEEAMEVLLESPVLDAGAGEAKGIEEVVTKPVS
jgi:hypothetical protein